MTFLSVVIPAYNEALAIRAGKLKRVTDWLTAQAFTTELIVVDDGSEDDTPRLARDVTGGILRIAHAGKAAALVAGLERASGDVILFTDMDQATPITEAPKLLNAIGQSAAVAVGSRGLVRPGAPVGRYLVSWGQVILRTMLLGLRMADTQCGFKAMTRSVAQDVLPRLHLYHPTRSRAIHGPSVTSGFDVEFLFVARRLGYRIQEVPVVWDYQKTRRVNLAKDTCRGVRDLLSIRLTDWRGHYPKRSRPARASGSDSRAA